MDFLEHAIDALLNSKDKCEVLSTKDNERYSEKFFESYPFTSWGTINWDLIREKMKVTSLDQISLYLRQHGKNIDQEIYITWGEDSLPLIKCSFGAALANMKVILKVGTYGTWLFNPVDGWVVEFYHHGDITVGIIDKNQK